MYSYPPWELKKMGTASAPPKALANTGFSLARAPKVEVRPAAKATSAGNKRPGVFTLSAVPQKKASLKTPSASDVGAPRWTPPPLTVSEKLKNSGLAMGVDIESAGWEFRCGSKGGRGQFGHYCFCSPEKLMQGRMVQLGWVVGKIGQDCAVQVAKERLIRPSGFTISPAATKECHGIETERALAEGLPLEEVLAEFMEDLRGVVRQGGRLVAHHLDFDLGVIDNELERTGLAHLRKELGQAARAGCCSMDPEIGRWVRMCFG